MRPPTALGPTSNTSTCLKQPPYRNEYYLLERGKTEIDLTRRYDLGWGFDYHINVFRQIEKQGSIRGLRFFLSHAVPVGLPAPDDKTVLFIIGDEKYEHADFLQKLLCIFRCYGPRPIYLDGMPKTALKRAALIHFLYKTSVHVRSRMKFRGQSGSQFALVGRKTVHLPLGYFRNSEAAPVGILDRSIDFAFLGSVDFEERQKKWYHRFFSSPKILSRKNMVQAFEQASDIAIGKIWLTSDFEESIKNDDDYSATMANTKISVVPRGTSYETLRFFESAKAGCVIVCEKLPKEWCYENHPGIELDDWQQLPDLIRSLLDRPDILEKRSLASLEYWSSRCSEQAVAHYVAAQLQRRM